MLQEEKKTEIIEVTRKWLESVIIGLNLCPFAKAPYQQGRIRFSVGDAKDMNGFLQLFLDELILLETDASIETTLLILPALGDIEAHFMPYMANCEKTIVFNDAGKKYQIVSFHPYARFAGLPANSPKNLTGMGPYPIVHILRVPSVEGLGAKIKTDVQTENDRRLGKMGQQEFMRIWKDIME